MYADIVVLTYQAPDINYFTYLIPKNLEEEIKVGQLVQVPFGNRTPMGVVVGLHVSHPEPFDVIASETKQSQGKLREESRDSFPALRGQNDTSRNQNDKRVLIKLISSIVLKTPLLLPYQIEILKWISAYYISPMVNCLEAMLPEIPKRVAQLEGLPTAHSLKSEQDFPNDFSKRALTGRKVVTGPAQTLVLVPTINRLPQALAQFPKAKNYVTYHNELKTSEKFSTWLKILSGEVDYIFGSRSAIFTPCPKLKEIIIFDEHDGAYKDERSPYYDTLTIAEKISTVTGAKIQIIDSAPKISTYYSLQRHSGEQRDSRIRSIDSGQVDSGRARMTIEQPAKKITATIVSMKEERLAQNFSPISATLFENLQKNQKIGKNSLLFLNKKKESGSLYCKNCQSHIYLEKQPETCPNCSSSDFYFNILNITSLAKEVRRQVPNAKINLISDKTGNWKLETGNSIDIATASIFYAPQLKKYDLVAHISPDTLLNRADFSSSEALYGQITNLKTLLKKDGALVLQTHDPENLIIKSAASGNYGTYYHEQLKLRQALFYPPFALLIKLTVKGKDKQKLEAKANKLADNLKTAYKIPVTILGPYSPIFFSKQTTYSIILKYKLAGFGLQQRQEAIKALLPTLKRIDKAFQITVEPKSIN